eukprot:8028502-Pyramimonas_sp.AAC.1
MLSTAVKGESHVLATSVSWARAVDAKGPLRGVLSVSDSDGSNAKAAATMLTSVVAEGDGDEGGDDVEEDEPEGEDDVDDSEDTEDDGCKWFAVAGDTIGARACEEAPSFA